MAGIFEFGSAKEKRQPEESLLYDCISDGELAAEVLKRSTPFIVPADGVLFREGDAPNGIFFVREGIVTLTILADGHAVFCARAEAGSLLGLPSTVSGKVYSMSAKVSDGARIEHLSPESYWELMQSCPNLAIHVLKILAGEVRTVRKVLADMRSQSPPIHDP